MPLNKKGKVDPKRGQGDKKPTSLCQKRKDYIRFQQALFKHYHLYSKSDEISMA